MKRNFCICSLLTISMLLIPLLIMKSEPNKPENITEISVTENGSISVMKSENGRVDMLTPKEYIVGVLAAEMDPDCHDEALKAQAVAAYTYALYIKQTDNPDDLNGADISDDPDSYQGYLDIEERREKWGERFEENEKKFNEIADSVEGKVIYYDGKPILAAYHDLNSGKTESAETVWKKDIPYLVQVESPGDRLCTYYVTEVKLTYDEFGSAIKKIDGVELDKGREKWIGEVERTESGYVLSVTVCGSKVSSVDFRNIFDLNSCCFDIKSDKEGVTIKVKGNGHMVGLSQYGADYMARQGSGYEEILKSYYSDVEIL